MSHYFFNLVCRRRYLQLLEVIFTHLPALHPPFSTLKSRTMYGHAHNILFYPLVRVRRPSPIFKTHLCDVHTPYVCVQNLTTSKTCCAKRTYHDVLLHPPFQATLTFHSTRCVSTALVKIMYTIFACCLYAWCRLKRVLYFSAFPLRPIVAQDGSSIVSPSNTDMPLRSTRNSSVAQPKKKEVTVNISRENRASGSYQLCTAKIAVAISFMLLLQVPARTAFYSTTGLPVRAKYRSAAPLHLLSQPFNMASEAASTTVQKALASSTTDESSNKRPLTEESAAAPREKDAKIAKPSAEVSLYNVQGLFAVQKPLTWTSQDAVGYLRKMLEQDAIKNRGYIDDRPKKRKPLIKIGHGGTLDPLATGVLVVGLGNGTKGLQK
jgi:hypothetical protein